MLLIKTREILSLPNSIKIICKYMKSLRPVNPV